MPELPEVEVTRRRIAPLALEIRTVRSRGYLMQPQEAVLQH